jgi:hypothetical protein
MVVSIDCNGQEFRERVLLLQALRHAVCCQIKFWDCINTLERLTDMDSDAQLWVENASESVTSGSDLTKAHVKDFLARDFLHVVGEDWHFADCDWLLPHLMKAIDLQLKFLNALAQLKKLIPVKCDPTRWITTTSTIVEGPDELTMADVDEYMSYSA